MGRLAAILLGAIVLLAGSAGSVDASYGGASCTRWSSTTVPPKTIRVYRVKEGLVDTVNFRLYVQRVTASEWGAYLPYQLQMAGAVAVKQYAWYYILHYRGGRHNGRCFDVRDTTADQIYRANRIVRASTVMAVNATWNWRVVKPGFTFFMTGYRTGRKVGCGRDINGWKLYARSARRCANAGWSAKKLLTEYYRSKVRW